jgi:TP901 family phage tail tape measure protein
MPEEITQKLGFDASQAVKALSDLRQNLNAFKKSLADVGGALNQFDKKARPVVTAMKTMAAAARSAASAMLKLSSASKISQSAVGQSNKSLQTAAVSAKNLSGMYSQAVTGMGISAQQMAGQISASNTKAAASAAKVGTAMQQAGQKLQKSVKAAGSAAVIMGNKMQQAGAQGAHAAQAMTISWTTVLRVIQAQVIIRAFSAIVSGMQSSAKAALEFELAIAEIKTIAPPLLGDMEKISDQVRELGKNLSVSAQVVAEGLYQTLSNQVVEASEAFEFLERAQKLAVITTSETKDAVNALSSVMNSYRMSAEDTEHVAGTLFKTVELGRLRLVEFADILGRVTPLTADLGIEWEEVAASLAVMTRQGVKVNTALTQLRAIVLKLIKPTDEMLKLFRRWGVKDAAQAIKKFGGLVGLLKQLSKESGGASAEMAKYFNRVRAIAGQMGIMTGEGELVAETLAEIKESTTEATEAFEEFSQVPAFKINKALSRIQIIFEELASKALPTLAEMLEFIVAIIPSVEEMASAFKTFGTAIVGIGAVLAVLVVAFTKTFAKISDSIDVVLTSAQGLGSGLESAAKQISNIWLEPTDNAAKFFNFLEEQSDKQAKQFADTRREILKTDKEHWTKLTKDAWVYFSEISLVWQRLETVVEAGVKSTAEVTGRMWDAVIKGGKDTIKDLIDLQDNFYQKIKNNEADTAKTRQKFAEQDFQLKLDAAQGYRKNSLINQQIDKKIASAKKKFNKIDISGENLRHGVEMTNRAQEMALEQIRYGREAGNRGIEAKGRKKLNQARNAELTARAKYAQLLQKAGSSDEAQRFGQNAERKIVLMNEYKGEWTKLQTELAKQEDSTSKRSSDLRISLTELEKKIRENLFSAEEMQMAELLGMDEGLELFNTGINNVLQNAKFAWNVEVDRLQEIISQTMFELKTDFGDIDDKGLKDAIQETLGRPRLPREDISQFLGKGFDKASEKLQELKKDEVNMQATNNKLQQTYAGVVAVMKEMSLEAPNVAGVSDALPPDLIPWARQSAEIQARVAQREDKRFDALKSSLIAAAADTMKLGVVRTDNLEMLDKEVDSIAKGGRLTRENISLIKGSIESLLGVTGEAAKGKEFLEKWESQPVESYRKSVEGIAQHQGDWVKSVEKTKDKTEEISTETATIKDKTAEVVTQEGLLTNSYVNSTTELKNQTEQRNKHLSQVDQLIAKERTLAQISGGGAAGEVAGGATGEVIGGDIGGVTGGVTGDVISGTVPGAGEVAGGLSPANLEQATISMDSLSQEASKIAEVVLNLGEAFSNMVPPINEAVWRVMDIETSIGDSIEQGKMLIGNWNQIAEKIAETSGVVNDFINTSADAKLAGDNVKVAWDSVNVTLSSVVAIANQVATAMRAAADAARAAAAAIRDMISASASVGGGAAYYGGPAIRYQQRGGSLAVRSQARGMDRIPVMASPGEFIVNSRSARQFSTELQALNTGRTPNFRDRGGSVTSIGDINVSINSRDGDTPTQSARQIGLALRRELRRNTIKPIQSSGRSKFAASSIR